MQYNPQNGTPYPQQQQHANGGANYGAPQYANRPPSQTQGSKGNKPPADGKKPKGKKPASFYVAVVIAAIAVIAAGVFAYMTLSQPAKSARNGNAIIGQLEGKSEEEIMAELNRVVEEGMFNISIASYVEYDGPDSEGEIKIENVPGNHYLMQVEVKRNDTGEVIYTSDILEPNYHIQWAKLDKAPPKGTYECTAVFHALDMETEEEVGTAGAVMNVTMKS